MLTPCHTLVTLPNGKIPVVIQDLVTRKSQEAVRLVEAFRHRMIMSQLSYQPRRLGEPQTRVTPPAPPHWMDLSFCTPSMRALFLTAMMLVSRSITETCSLTRVLSSDADTVPCMPSFSYGIMHGYTAVQFRSVIPALAMITKHQDFGQAQAVSRDRCSRAKRYKEGHRSLLKRIIIELSQHPILQPSSITISIKYHSEHSATSITNQPSNHNLHFQRISTHLQATYNSRWLTKLFL